MIRKLRYFAVFMTLALTLMVTALAQTSKQGTAKPLSALKFEQDEDVPCLMSALETGDPATGATTFMIKAPPKCLVRWHYHTAEEHLIVIRGAVLTEMEGMSPTLLESGGFAMMPGKAKHQFSCQSNNECVMIVSFDRPYDIFWAEAANRK